MDELSKKTSLTGDYNFNYVFINAQELGILIMFFKNRILDSSEIYFLVKIINHLSSMT
jgi:hypothetical protein